MANTDFVYLIPETTYETVGADQKSTDAIVVSVLYEDDSWQVKLPGGIDAFKCKWAGTDIVIGKHFKQQMCNSITLDELFSKCNKDTTIFWLLSPKPSGDDTPCIQYYNSYLNSKLQHKKTIKLYNIYDDSYIKIDKTRCC